MEKILNIIGTLGRSIFLKQKLRLTFMNVREFVFLALLALVAVSASANAQDSSALQVGDLRLANAWIRTPPPAAPVAGGFIAIQNTSSTDDRLVSASADISAKVQLHTMVMKGDVMQMSELPDGIPIPAGQTITLRPRELHIMFSDLNQALVTGNTVPVNLTFAKAGIVRMNFDVRTQGAP